ncbi:MAG: NADH-quinone oxidoreductase subunit J [Cytophagaceae bacterium]|nr:NADH-quinone oxidoreductase subunit J [Cytophagaceae bacterium]
MSFTAYIFYFFAFMTIVSAIFILTTRNVLYAAFALLGTFLGVSALYVFAGADFLAMAQIMIYIGGVLILILFGIMLTNRIAEHQYLVSSSRNSFFAVTGGVTLFGVLIIAILKANFTSLLWIQEAQKKASVNSTMEKIGENLMTDFVFPFEVAAVILMAALMGAAFIASQVVKK